MMQLHEQKALASIAHELLRITEDGSEKGSVIGSGDACMTKSRVQELAPESEIEREMNRLRRAHESVRFAAEVLWKRTGIVVYPPAPAEAGCSTAIESCRSQLGNDIQQQALHVDSTAGSLRYLADSLAL
jgi:hypothetical protein